MQTAQGKTCTKLEFFLNLYASALRVWIEIETNIRIYVCICIYIYVYGSMSEVSALSGCVMAQYNQVSRTLPASHP